MSETAPLRLRADTDNWADLEPGEFAYRRDADGRVKWLHFWPLDSRCPLSAAVAPQRNGMGASWSLSGTDEAPTLGISAVPPSPTVATAAPVLVQSAPVEPVASFSVQDAQSPSPPSPRPAQGHSRPAPSPSVTASPAPPKPPVGANGAPILE